MRSASILAFLGACAPVGGVGETAEPVEAPVEAPTEDVGEPVLSAADVAALLETRLAQARPDPSVLEIAYTELMGHRELWCPLAATPTLDVWTVWATIQTETCTTEEGWTWFGLANGQSICDIDPEGTSTVGMGALVSFNVVDAEGGRYDAGGTFYQDCTWTADAGSCWGALTGSFTFAGADGWLGEGIEVSTFVTDTWVGDAHTVVLDGGAGYRDGDVAFRSLTFSGGAVTGAIEVRDPTGYWHELVLDGDGCGTLTWRGQDEGPLCVDLSGWAGAMDRGEYACSSP